MVVNGNRRWWVGKVEKPNKRRWRCATEDSVKEREKKKRQNIRNTVDIRWESDAGESDKGKKKKE